MAGKLNGVIPAQTPNGVRNDMVSMSLAMPCIVSPSCKLVTLQQCSTTSENVKERLLIILSYVKQNENLRRPLRTSPSASTVVFPCSSVMLLANSFYK